MNISRASLFPGLDGLALSLKFGMALLWVKRLVMRVLLEASSCDSVLRTPAHQSIRACVCPESTFSFTSPCDFPATLTS